jgi:hypothetical protein
MKLTEPEEVADTCFAGMVAGQFWILPPSQRNDKQVSERTDSILRRQNPELQG